MLQAATDRGALCCCFGAAARPALHTSHFHCAVCAIVRRECEPASTRQTHLRQRQLVNGHIGHALDLLHAGKGFSCNQFGASYGCCCSRAPWLTETSAILKSTPGISHLRK
ncbi:hypothetical protein WJX73_001301 [Symbiochloris irregularis]|uniref:Secreted protein n=1 Tax=Symbiochloris irregularis TaxID=706552 RepID=A0AAW1NSF4_9CHLO